LVNITDLSKNAFIYQCFRIIVHLYINVVNDLFNEISLFFRMSGFRENLRNELDFQDIKVKELSDKCGIPKATLECYLRTQAVEPSAENAVKIARALRVSVEHLVIGEGKAAFGKPRTLSRETQEIIRLLENLTPEQRKAVQRLLTAFKG
jgi:transcriptional regulator with XRE-family HTH domain